MLPGSPPREDGEPLEDSANRTARAPHGSGDGRLAGQLSVQQNQPLVALRESLQDGRDQVFRIGQVARFLADQILAIRQRLELRLRPAVAMRIRRIFSR